MASRYNEAGYFYDEQFRRYILQFMRLFGGLLIKTGKGKDGTEKFIKVPCRYSDMQRMVAHILKNNSENVVNSCPFITSHILTLQPDRTRTLDPLYTDKQHVTERKFDDETGKYTSDIGNMYTVERAMPTPYTLTMQIDIWTSNTDQKLQLMEQILVLFNPSIELQANTNILDWTSLTVVELTDISWSARGVPQGIDSQIDVASLTFTMPCWVSPPVKIQQQKLIHQITARTQDIDPTFNPEAFDFFGNSDYLNRQIITPSDTSIKVVAGTPPQIQLLNHAGINDNGKGGGFDWSEYLLPYGGLTENVTQIRLRLQSNPELETNPNDIVGTISSTGTKNVVDFTVDADTLPGTDLTVNAVIDPHSNYPGDGTLPAAVANQRYLILDDIGATGAANETNAWANLVASKNDIIQYNGSIWVVHYDASANTGPTYIQNNFTGEQFKWDGTEWANSYQGRYYPGFWRIVN